MSGATSAYTRIGPDDPSDIQSMASANPPMPASVPTAGASQLVSGVAPSSTGSSIPSLPSDPATEHLMSAAVHRNFMLSTPNADMLHAYRLADHYVRDSSTVRAIVNLLRHEPESSIDEVPLASVVHGGTGGA